MALLHLYCHEALMVGPDPKQVRDMSGVAEDREGVQIHLPPTVHVYGNCLRKRERDLSGIKEIFRVS
eukprot:1366474-Amphidinium_carterae.1